MVDSTITNEGVTAREAVRQATHDVASALAETPEFRAFEQARERLRQDRAAQQAIDVYQAKLQSLQALLQLNAVSAEDQAELERLRRAALEQRSLIEYSRAQEDLKRLCQAVGDSLSARVGLDFASVACAGGCC
jgi:cell fate (sporulation/competence/biofilm development) regulator YlbF (YheA/YmcA/DUF963 family)